MKHILTATTDAVRLDTFISLNIQNISRSYATTLIQSSNVTVDGVIIVKPSHKIRLNDVVTVDVPDPVLTYISPEDIPLDILYEDSDLLVINKPQGMVVHPAPGHSSGTLVNALLHYCKGELSDINGIIRPGIIHRIDKDTSGLLIAVKNNDIHTKMAKMISNHDVIRKYRCCVYGLISSDKGTIDAPIGRSASDRKKMAVIGTGKSAVTHFEVVERLMDATDLSLRLETGRTHQIRAHLAYIGHPAIGDPVYARKMPSYGLMGQALHSKSLEFTHPRTGKLIFVDSDLPDYYIRLQDELRSSFSV
jgi:23S rRNA pseudouridine1911/1915/1917 synthase